jgi:dihydrofolate synthase / folylpolyglutamate synthase
MNYQQTLDFLFSQLPMFQRDGASAYKANLDNTIALDDYFGQPHRHFQTIHVAGTNGKGSVSHMLASVLQCAGYKTGLYTSPHLKDFRERIKINGLMIPEFEVVDFVLKHQGIIETLKPSFFELTVAMAFDFFARQNIDIAVIEVGMGGRLDSTNIITPLVSVITNIGYDHVQFLGSTLNLIAGEKAGIIKKDIPVVIGETHPETESVFNHVTKNHKSPIIYADKIRSIGNSFHGDNGLSLQVMKGTNEEFHQLTLDLQGFYQKKNILTVLATLDQLNNKLSISSQQIKDGVSSTISSTGLKGRWYKLSEHPLMICDTGHNEHGLQQVVEQIKLTKYNKLHIVLGMVNDKDHNKVLQLLPTHAEYYFTRAAIPRALDEKLLMEMAGRFNLKGKCYPTVPLAIDAAKASASPDDFIFIGGSTFVVADIPEL